MIKVTVWNEYLHEKSSNEVAGVYPAGIHGCIKNFLSTQEDMTVRTATLSQRHCGLPDEGRSPSASGISWNDDPNGAQ